jgi:hypothetical protein
VERPSPKNLSRLGKLNLTKNRRWPRKLATTRNSEVLLLKNEKRPGGSEGAYLVRGPTLFLFPASKCIQGRQLFERNKNLEEDTLLEEDAVSVDISQYERSRRDEDENEDEGITFSDSD